MPLVCRAGRGPERENERTWRLQILGRLVRDDTQFKRSEDMESKRMSARYVSLDRFRRLKALQRSSSLGTLGARHGKQLCATHSGRTCATESDPLDPDDRQSGAASGGHGQDESIR